MLVMRRRLLVLPSLAASVGDKLSPSIDGESSVDPLSLEFRGALRFLASHGRGMEELFSCDSLPIEVANWDEIEVCATSAVV